jgi:hypothetical protein
MRHEEATTEGLVERYLLGEMAEPERAAFEEHYFSCAVCAEEVVSAAKFVDNARRPLLRLEPEAKPNREARPARAPEPNGERGGERVATGAPWWERWLTLAPKPALAGACGVLALALVWQNRPAGQEPEVTGSYFVTATRAADGAPRKIQLLPGQQRVALLFNHTDTTVGEFRFLLENAAGRTVQEFGGTAPRDTNDIQVMIPVTGLGGGRYTLRVLNAATRSEIAALPFALATP